MSTTPELPERGDNQSSLSETEKHGTAAYACTDKYVRKLMCPCSNIGMPHSPLHQQLCKTYLILSQHTMLAVSAAALAMRVEPLPTGKVQELSLEVTFILICSLLSVSFSGYVFTAVHIVLVCTVNIVLVALCTMQDRPAGAV